MSSLRTSGRSRDSYVLAGYLQRRGKWRFQWLERYYVLTLSHLHEYKKSRMDMYGEERAVWPMGALIITPIAHKRVFRLSLNTQSLHSYNTSAESSEPIAILRAATAQEFQSWGRAFADVLTLLSKKLHYSSTHSRSIPSSTKGGGKGDDLPSIANQPSTPPLVEKHSHNSSAAAPSVKKRSDGLLTNHSSSITPTPNPSGPSSPHSRKPTLMRAMTTSFLDSKGAEDLMNHVRVNDASHGKEVEANDLNEGASSDQDRSSWPLSDPSGVSDPLLLLVLEDYYYLSSTMSSSSVTCLSEHILARNLPWRQPIHLQMPPSDHATLSPSSRACLVGTFSDGVRLKVPLSSLKNDSGEQWHTCNDFYRSRFVLIRHQWIPHAKNNKTDAAGFGRLLTFLEPVVLIGWMTAVFAPHLSYLSIFSIDGIGDIFHSTNSPLSAFRSFALILLTFPLMIHSILRALHEWSRPQRCYSLIFTLLEAREHTQTILTARHETNAIENDDQLFTSHSQEDDEIHQRYLSAVPVSDHHRLHSRSISSSPSSTPLNSPITLDENTAILHAADHEYYKLRKATASNAPRPKKGPVSDDEEGAVTDVDVDSDEDPSDQLMRQEKESAAKHRAGIISPPVPVPWGGWSEDDVTKLVIRGKNYLTDRKKIGAGLPVYKLLHVEHFYSRGTGSIRHIASRPESFAYRYHAEVQKTGGIRKNQLSHPLCPLFIINFLYPGPDSKDMNLTAYFGRRIRPADMLKKSKEKLEKKKKKQQKRPSVTATKEEATAAEGASSSSSSSSSSVLSSSSDDEADDWCTEMDEWENSIDIDRVAAFDRMLSLFVEGSDDFRDGRLKMVPRIADGPWLVKKGVGCTPAITGRKMKHYYYRDRVKNYIECDIDANSTIMAGKILSLCKSAATALTIDLTFVLQGEDQDELPESILGGFRVIHVDMNKILPFEENAKFVTPDLTQ